MDFLNQFFLLCRQGFDFGVRHVDLVLDCRDMVGDSQEAVVEVGELFFLGFVGGGGFLFFAGFELKVPGGRVGVGGELVVFEAADVVVVVGGGGGFFFFDDFFVDAVAGGGVGVGVRVAGVGDYGLIGGGGVG